MRTSHRLLALACALLPLPAFAIGTAFTYQGTLEESGAVASGSYDLQFQLLDAGNAAVGAPLVADNVNVVDGVFTVQLDFGAAAFDGDDRRMRIAVRPGASVGAFTPLNPPTALTATPYAQVSSVAEIASSIANNTVNSARIVNGSIKAEDVDSTQVQVRVAGVCLAGSSIRAIDPAGAVTCQPDAGGGGAFTLPFASTQADAGALFSLTNSGDGPGLVGINSTTTSNVSGVRGAITSTSPGGFSSAVRGDNAGTGGLGIGVWGSHAGSGWGVYGVTPNGLGVYGNSSAGGTGVYANSNTGTGLTATSNNGPAASISIFNNANNNTVLNASTLGNGTVIDVTSSGNGAGVRSSTGSGFAVEGITSAQTSAGIIGRNTGAGEAVVGLANSNIAGAVVGRNDGGGYGVRGFIATNTSNTGVGVFGQVGLNGSTGMAGRFENLNTGNTEANTLQVTSNSNGNIPDNTLGNVASFTNTNTNSVSAAVRGEVRTIFGNFGAAGIYGVSAGTGGFAGLFHASNPAGNGASVVAINAGNGNAITANTDKGGNGVETSVDGAGNALYAWVPSFATGRAARAVNFNTANTNPPLTVEQHSNGSIAVFKSGDPGTVNVARINSAGRGFFNGGTQVGGADLAEVVSISGATPEPGDVVEIDPAAPSHFRLAATPRSSLVAGVISTEPGVTLNRPGADETTDEDAPALALALAGRVPVKVTDENGAVAPGDLLVASSTPGHAMRASPNPGAGTVVGKALEAFADASVGTDAGVIEMLVMLR